MEESANSYTDATNHRGGQTYRLPPPPRLGENRDGSLRNLDNYVFKRDHGLALGEPYFYKSLAEGDIRVFEFDKGRGQANPPSKDRVSGRLRSVRIPTIKPAVNKPVLSRQSEDTTLHGQARHEALSYAWGPTYADGAHLTEYIICDGRRLDVTRNLYAAMERVRDDVLGAHRVNSLLTGIGPRLSWWIDAICINQQDPDERSSQVAQMHRIFERAEGITGWLGETPSGGLGGELLDLLRRPSRRAPKYVVEQLLQLPWFHRRWVVQEVASTGNEYSVRLGGAKCEYRAIYDHVRSHALTSSAGPMWLRTRPLTMLQAMFIYRNSQCSNPLDRIYALRAICSDGWQVPVDYRQSVREAYLRFALQVTVVEAESSEQDTTRAVTTSNAGYDPFREVQSVEMLRLLALATCFKSSPGEVIGYSPESWVPDWQYEATFESPKHQEALERLTAPDFDAAQIQDDVELPTGQERDGFDHVYLWVPGRMLLTPTVARALVAKLQQQPGVIPEWNVDEGWQLSGSLQSGKQVWLPWLRRASITDSLQRGPGGIAFVLVPSNRYKMYQHRRVYRLHSCFLWSQELVSLVAAELENAASRAAGRLSDTADEPEGFWLQ